MIDESYDWRNDAECASVAAADIFMEDAWINEHAVTRAAAEAICRECPVRELCLRDALHDPESEGIRGGFHFSRGALLSGDRIRLKDTFPNMASRLRHRKGPAGE